jgi:hypothetical protein
MERKTTSLTVTKETLATWGELSERSRIPLSKIMEDIAKELKPILDESESERVAFGVMRVPNKKHVMLAFVPIFCGSFEIPVNATDKQTDKAIRKRLKRQ